QRERAMAVALSEPTARGPRGVGQAAPAFFERPRATATPGAKARIFGTRIRRNIKLAECPSFGQSIFGYAPKSHGAEDYAALAREVLGDSPTVLSARVERDDSGQVTVLNEETGQAAASPIPDVAERE